MRLEASEAVGPPQNTEPVRKCLHLVVSNVPRHGFLATRAPVLASPLQLRCPMNLSVNVAGVERTPTHEASTISGCIASATTQQDKVYPVFMASSIPENQAA